MTDETRPGEVFEFEPTQSDGLLAQLPWWLIAMVALVVAELTTHPSIGVVVFCLKFGWNDFQTAFWLRRHDPIPVRGKVCSWFYLSSGLWRVCISGFALMFALVPIIAIAEARQAAGGVPQNAGGQPPAELITCMIVWMLSSLAATAVTFLAVGMAHWFPFKIWVSAVVPESRRRGDWPPGIRIGARPASNVFKWWLILSAIVVSVPLVVAGFVVLAATLGGPGARAAGQANLGLLACMVLVIGLPLTVVLVCERNFRRLGATDPTECWLKPLPLADSDPSG